jgi:hypothetical protein
MTFSSQHHFHTEAADQDQDEELSYGTKVGYLFSQAVA